MLIISHTYQNTPNKMKIQLESHTRTFQISGSPTNDGGTEIRGHMFHVSENRGGVVYIVGWVVRLEDSGKILGTS